MARFLSKQWFQESVFGIKSYEHIDYRRTNRLPITEALTSPTKKEGKGIVRQKKFIESFIKGEVKNTELWEKYKRAYFRIPIVTAAIDVTCDNAIQTFYITGENEEYKETINDLIHKFNLVEFFYNVAKQMLIFGNSFVEIVQNSKGITDLKILPPLMMYVNRGEKGNFGKDQNDAYLQYLPEKPTEPIKFKENEIVHFKWNPIGESAYGNSIIHPLLHILQIKLNTEGNLDTILDRYAAPLFHFQVGTPERPASQSEINSLSSDLEDIQADTELVTDDRVESKVLGTESKTLNLAPPLTYIENQVVSGLQVPLILLGRGDTDRAVAETQLEMFDRRSKTLQRTIKRIAEKQIFNVHLEKAFGEIDQGELPELTWGEPEQRQSREDMEMIVQLATAGVITPQKANDLLPEEYQEQLPEEMKNPAKFQAQQAEKMAQQKAIPGRSNPEPSSDRIKTARDKRKPEVK